MGEPGVYVSLEECPVQSKIDTKNFEWDVRQYEQEGRFAIVDAFTAGYCEAAKRKNTS